MAEVLVEYESLVIHDHIAYRARAVGRLAGHMWEGWLEFIPQNGDSLLVSGVESTQPERDHLIYWATGLTPIYLQGALVRAMQPVRIREHIITEPLSDGPAPRVITRRVSR